MKKRPYMIVLVMIAAFQCSMTYFRRLLDVFWTSWRSFGLAYTHERSCLAIILTSWALKATSILARIDLVGCQESTTAVQGTNRHGSVQKSSWNIGRLYGLFRNSEPTNKGIQRYIFLLRPGCSLVPSVKAGLGSRFGCGLAPASRPLLSLTFICVRSLHLLRPTLPYNHNNNKRFFKGTKEQPLKCDWAGLELDWQMPQ